MAHLRRPKKRARVKREVPPGPVRPPEDAALRPRASVFADRRLNRPKDARRSFEREDWS